MNAIKAGVGYFNPEPVAMVTAQLVECILQRKLLCFSGVLEMSLCKRKVKAIPCVLPGTPLDDCGNPQQFRPIGAYALIESLVTSLKILISEKGYHLIQIQI